MCSDDNKNNAVTKGSSKVDHVLYADVRLCVSPPFTWMSVVFTSLDEIDALIRALCVLRDDRADHFHLQYYGLSKSSPLDEGEITFLRSQI